MIRQISIGYSYCYMQRTRYGWRQVGPEMMCLMDDFGTLFQSHGAKE